MGGLLAQAASSSKWETVGSLAEQLPSLVDTDIDKHWKLIIALKESRPIGKEGGGTVIGVNPHIGLRYTFDDGKTVEFFGSMNLRFATEEAAPFGMRYSGLLGIKVGAW